MARKRVDFPHIRIEGRAAIFEKGYGHGGKPLPAGGLNYTQFKNKLSQVLSVQDIRAQFQGKLFFEIDLRVDYCSPVAQKLFQQLGVDVRSVFPAEEGQNKRVIVSGTPDLVRRFHDKSVYSQDLLRCVENIQQLDSTKKIGESIKKIWATKSKVKVEIAFINKPSTTEIAEFQKILGDTSKNITLGKYTSTASASLTKKEIEDIAQIPIVKRIGEQPKWAATFLSKAANLSSDFKILPPDKPDSLPQVCVIDTGIAHSLRDYAATHTIVGEVYDTDGHGTAVASACMFNKNDLTSANTLTPSIRIISHKISETDENNEINFFDEILHAIDTHNADTKIFCLSWNCINYDDIAYEDRLKELDDFIREKNILLVNSAGNLDREFARARYRLYPNYLLENPVMTPSESKYTFSVGATYHDASARILLSSINRLLLPMLAVNCPEDCYIRIKPEVFAEGGFIRFGANKDQDVDLLVPCLDKNGKKCAVVGTSIAAPQIARMAAILLDAYRYRNIETLKSAIFIKCRKFVQRFNQTTGYEGRAFVSESDIIDADDGFYYFFEGKTKPHERVEDLKKDKVDAMSWEFPVTKEIAMVEFSVCHSNSNPFETIQHFSTRMVTSIHRPGREGALAKDKKFGGTIGKNAPLVYGTYGMARSTPEGMWSIKAYVETSGIPRERMKEVEIRYGVTVKLHIKPEYLDKKREIYFKILTALGKDASAYASLEEITPVENKTAAKASSA